MSISQQLSRRSVLYASAWRRHGRDVGDPNVFFGTTITIPNSVDRQKASGFSVRLDASVRRGWSTSISYSHARVVQYGPVTGGLFLEDDVLAIADGHAFTPDHDQRHSIVASTTFANEQKRVHVTGGFRYQSGTPVSVDLDAAEELRGRRGSAVVDFSTGRVHARMTADLQVSWMFRQGKMVNLSWSGWITNITDQTYAFNFGNPFSGTHFGAPRRFGMSLNAEVGRGSNR